MKKSLLALALISAFSTAAFAQSSVTVYGIADAGIQSLKNGTPAGSTVKLQSGQTSGSRLGFKGTEDLGNGLKANFVLEMGLNVDDGSSGQGATFGRRSTVGLSGDFGTLDLGRDKTPTNKFVDGFDPFASGYINSGNGLNTVYYTGGRTNNAIYYSTPNFSGFSAAASYAFGEQAGSTSAKNSIGANLFYKIDALEVGYSFQKDNTQAVVAGPINPVKANTVAASYDFGMIKPVLIYQTQKDDAALALDKKVVTLGATIKLDSVNQIVAGYSMIKDDTRKQITPLVTVAKGDAKQFALGYSYTMSKRTNLYASAARTTQDANSQAFGAAVAGADVTEFVVGIRHKF